MSGPFQLFSQLTADLYPGSGGPGALGNVPRSAQSFHHGERTADRGRLGDDSGSIEVFATQPLQSQRVRWELSAPLRGFDAPATFDAGVSNGATPPLVVHAGRPGLYLLRLHALVDGEPDGELGRLVLSVPQFVRVDLDAGFTAALERLATDAGIASDVVLANVRAVAHHVLRPANIRLLWPDDAGDYDVPPQYRTVGHGTVQTDGLVTGPDEQPVTLGGSSSFWLERVSLSVPDDVPATDPFSVAVEAGSPAAVVADDDLAPVSPDTTVADHLAGVADPNSRRRLTARWLGVALARAVLRGLGFEQVTGTTGDVLVDALADPKRWLLGIAPVSGVETDLVEHYADYWGLIADPNADRYADRFERLTAFDVLAGALHDGSLPDLEGELPLGPAYGGYHLRLEDRDADTDPWDPNAQTTNGPRYGGDEIERAAARPGALPASGEAFVEQLQYDLRQVGILLPPNPVDPADNRARDAVGSMGPIEQQATGRTAYNDPQFRTDWAVREFQVASHYPQTTADRLRGAAVYAMNLDPVWNPDRPRIDVTGVVDAPTAWHLRRWRFARLRYPIVVEAWDRGTGGFTAIHQHNNEPCDNVWEAKGVPTNAPRMLVRDCSGYDQADGLDAITFDTSVPATVPPGAQAGPDGPTAPQNPPAPDDRITFGQFSPWPADDPNDPNQPPPELRQWGGPNMIPSIHVDPQMEVTPSNAFAGVDRMDDLTADQRSVFKAVCAVSAVESRGFFDLAQAYDSAVMSSPLYHYTMALGRQADGEGELPGLLAFVHHRDAERYRRLFGDFGLWFSHVYGDSQGRNTTARGRPEWKHMGKAVVLTRAERDPDEFVGALERRKHDTDASLRGYTQWFRSWHWFYRQVRAVRVAPALRRDIYQFGLRRIADLLDAAVNNTSVAELFTSEMAVAALLRIHIRSSATAPVAGQNGLLQTVEQVGQNATEAARLQAIEQFTRGTRVEQTTEAVVEWTAPTQVHQHNSILRANLQGNVDQVIGPLVNAPGNWGQSRLDVDGDSFPADNIGAPNVPNYDPPQPNQPQDDPWDDYVEGLPGWDT